MELKINEQRAAWLATESIPWLAGDFAMLLADRATMQAEIDRLKFEWDDEKRGHTTTAQALFEANAALKAVTAERDEFKMLVELAKEAIEDFKSALKVITAERDAAYGYASRLFTALAPRCTPLPNLMGVLTQIDNASTIIGILQSELATLRAGAGKIEVTDAAINAGVAAMGAPWRGNSTTFRIGFTAAFAHLGGEGETLKCKARAQGTACGNDPADCDWPGCGCDPHADKVLTSLEESGQTFSHGVEAAIRIIEGGHFLHDEAPPAKFAREVVAAIRSKFPKGGDATHLDNWRLSPETKLEVGPEIDRVLAAASNPVGREPDLQNWIEDEETLTNKARDAAYKRISATEDKLVGRESDLMTAAYRAFGPVTREGTGNMQAVVALARNAALREAGKIAEKLRKGYLNVEGQANRSGHDFARGNASGKRQAADEVLAAVLALCTEEGEGE